MDTKERILRLKQMLSQISDDGNIETLVREPATEDESGLESAQGLTDETVDQAHQGIRKIARDEDLDESDLLGLEAIVLPRERPVVFIENDSFGALPSPWTHFANSDVKSLIEAAIPSVGRVELPDTPWIPYGGTGFVVGDNLLMTNRHVAELFAAGLGVKNLTFRAGQTAAMDFKREKNSDTSINVRIRGIEMIHPHWDMAILRVDGLPEGHGKLTLSVLAPEQLMDRDIAVIGYPARDERNDLQLQERIFAGTYNVKRLHPGRIRQRESIKSFGHMVNAMTHDSSTLGGNSGSAVLDVSTGHIVGLHFAGIYLKANYCVPTYEMARDSRVVDAGLNFAQTIAPTDEWLAAWTVMGDEGVKTQRPKSDVSVNGQTTAPQPATLRVDGGSVSLTVPLNITISFGSPSMANGDQGTMAVKTEVETEKVPVIYPHMELRSGYQDNFLKLHDDVKVPLPSLSTVGKNAVAKLDDGSLVLNYHRFSVVMHKKRRLALFTAANVDWRASKRAVDGRKPTRAQLNGFTGGEKEDWLTDSRIPLDFQLPDYFYTKDGGTFDKGHLIRRDDVAWGDSFDDMQKGNGDTFHTTNCSPQTAEFNRAKPSDFNWGALENMIEKQTRSEKVCVFSGPVLDAEDRYFHGLVKGGAKVSIQIPQRFWKIIVANHNGIPAVFGFVLDQDLSGVDLHEEMAIPDAWKRFLRPISEIEGLLNGLVKLTWFKKYDQFEVS